MTIQKTDREGYDQYYQEQQSNFSQLESVDAFVQAYEGRHTVPFYQGGSTKGYVRGLTIKTLIEDAKRLNRPFEEIVILDAGSGHGELSVYLALKGFRMIGVDISPEGCALAEELAARFGVGDRCRFIAASLESIPIDPDSVDFVIGHAALHHFIKYEGVPDELARVMKPGGHGYFADAYAENPMYQLFHDKEKMERLGDVVLNKNLVEDYLNQFELELIPTDWFVMIDKFMMVALPKRFRPFIKRSSALFFRIDRKLPTSGRLALYFSGSLMTKITNPVA